MTNTMSRMTMIAVVSFVSAGSTAAVANDTGFAAGSHDLRREGGRLCIVDHYHGGTATAGTKGVAETYARQLWYDTTAGEYGTDWARWDRSAGKSVSFEKSGDAWSASVKSRPCR